MKPTPEMVREEELRTHALGAAISRREWWEVERAHAAIRDEFHARQRTSRAALEPAPVVPERSGFSVRSLGHGQIAVIHPDFPPHVWDGEKMVRMDAAPAKEEG